LLINIWYVAEWAAKLGKDPVRVNMLGQRPVLFLDEERTRLNDCRGSS